MNHRYQPTPACPVPLNRGGVEHDANRSAERSRRKGVRELRPDNAGVACRTPVSAKRIPHTRIDGRVAPTMWPCHLAPDDADLGAAHLLLAPVDIRDLLAQVEAVSFVNDGPLARWDPACETYLAPGVSSTPSILMRLVLGWVLWRPRW